jgi:hypothetical protein
MSAITWLSAYTEEKLLKSLNHDILDENSDEYRNCRIHREFHATLLSWLPKIRGHHVGLRGILRSCHNMRARSDLAFMCRRVTIAMARRPLGKEPVTETLLQLAEDNHTFSKVYVDRMCLPGRVPEGVSMHEYTAVMDVIQRLNERFAPYNLEHQDWMKTLKDNIPDTDLPLYDWRFYFLNMFDDHRNIGHKQSPSSTSF